ncbi:MAG: phenylalanine 4-monooxygenase [Gammaproteobacteria bacterium]|nr:phenylalanine 4-monooxygenase [Gammaproteobacteria bacterium]
MDARDNRYSDAPRSADYTIEQRWETYSHEEHDRWKRLYRRQQQVLPGRACDEYIKAIRQLDLSADGVPHMGALSDRLGKLTGWSVVPVAGLVPDDVFFDHLANKRFPAGAFIRPESEFDYLEEPDVFHDIFGHVPLLAVPVFSQFMQAYGQGGMRAMQLGQLKNLARLYWYTVEFGLVKSSDGLRIFGAGIMSSPHESVFSLEDASPNRVGFNLERIMRTKHIIDDFQQTYFVIDSLEQLLESCYQDFGDVYARVRSQPDYEAHEIVQDDVVLHRGTREYFEQKKAS